MKPCVRCTEVKNICSRGLCRVCRDWAERNNQLSSFARKNWKNEELIAELGFWKERGLTVRQSSEKLGVSFSAAQRAICRARARARLAGASAEIP